MTSRNERNDVRTVRLSSEFSQIRIGMKLGSEFPTVNFAPRWNLRPSENLLCVIRDRERCTMCRSATARAASDLADR